LLQIKDLGAFQRVTRYAVFAEKRVKVRKSPEM